MSSELARCNGVVAVADGETIGLVEVGGGGLGVTIFVLALVGGLTTMAGSFVLATFNIAAGAGVVGVGLSLLVVAILLVRKRRRDADRPLPAPWLVFDRRARVVRDGQGSQLCSFDVVRIERVLQVGSSSKVLAVHCPDKLIVARGTPFGDEVDSVEQVLRGAIA